jgi:hypothetical protein
MLIIDGDLYVYKAGFAYRGKEIGHKLINRRTSEIVDLGNVSLIKAKKFCKENGYVNSDWKLIYYNNPFPLHFILGKLDEIIQSLLNKFANHEYQMFITSSDVSNYRFNIATITPYKGSRRKCVKCFERCKSEFDRNKKVILICKNCGEVDKEATVQDKPEYYEEIRDHLIQRWNAELVHGQEADDAVSILAKKLSNDIDSNPIMVHIDKDINNTPGVHYNPDKELLYTIDYSTSIKNFYTQFLLGDRIDCIPGVIGIGPVLAEEIFKECFVSSDYEQIIMEIYQGEYIFSKRPPKNRMNLTPNEAYQRLVEIGQLLYIRQEENELWRPTIPQP